MKNAKQGLTSPKDSDFQIPMPCQGCLSRLTKQNWCGHHHRRCKYCCAQFNKRVDESLAGYLS